MSIIKELRKKSGFTQTDLSKETGLSLRTIQRLEANNKKPKGHTLVALSEVFNMEPSGLLNKFTAKEEVSDSDSLSIKIINLSALSLFIIPFGNILFPIIIWYKKRQSKIVDETGRRIINFQIIWSILLCILLSVSPFLGDKIPSPIPLILIILFTAMLINIMIISFTAISLQRNNLNFLNLPIRFL